MAVTSDVSNSTILAEARRVFVDAKHWALSSWCCEEQPNAVEWCVSISMDRRQTNRTWKIVARAFGRPELLLVLKSMKPVKSRLGVFNG